MNIYYFIATCGGKTNPDGACVQTADIPTRHGLQKKSSPGTCISPDNCERCAPYFYNNGPTCTGDTYDQIINMILK